MMFYTTWIKKFDDKIDYFVNDSKNRVVEAMEIVAILLFIGIVGGMILSYYIGLGACKC